MQEKAEEYSQNYYQYPQHSQNYPPQYQSNFKTQMKVLPYVLQMEDASLHLISERELQYLNQTKNFQYNLGRFAYQNSVNQQMQEPIRKLFKNSQ